MATYRALERVRPEQSGVDPKGIMHFIDSIEEKGINLHSFMLLRHGKVAAEGYFLPFDAELRHPIYSVSKSVTSAAVGIAIGEGLLTLEDRIIDFFPEKLSDAVHEYTAMMKVKHLLAMATVHPKSTDTQVDDWVGSFLNTPPVRPPGTIFAYDSTGTHTLCAILQKLTGMTLHDYLLPRLFAPLGFREIHWDSCPMNINKGGGGIQCTPEDMAKFGQLYLQDGIWEGVRLLPEGWVKLSTARHIDNSNATFLLDGKTGYGYQFWRARHGSYCAFGMGGQFVVVIPDKDAVFVSTANTLLHKDGQQLILDSLWESIYPALAEGTLDSDPGAYQKMKLRLDHLTLLFPRGSSHSAAASGVSGKRFILASNSFGFEACEFIFDGENSKLSFYKGTRRLDLSFGMKAWTLGTDPLLGLASAGAAAWTDEHTCLIHAQMFENLQMFHWTCHFEGGRVTMHLLPAGAMNLGTFECYLNGVSL